jgi:small subunit ribosomal protein S4
MARYIGPKARVNRRLSALIYEDRGSVRAMDRRESPPGMHTRPRRPSNYGMALQQKQKIKHYYGILEKQLRRYFAKASHMKGNTGEQLLLICERRLDNVIRRAGLATTRPAARQGVAHGHFQVNGVKVDKPSYQIRTGDVISVRGRDNLNTLYRSNLAEQTSEPADWITLDAENLQIAIQSLPGTDDISLPVDANVVVEFLSR